MVNEFSEHDPGEKMDQEPLPESVIFSECGESLQFLQESARTSIAVRCAPEGPGTFFLDGVQVSGYKRDGLINIKPTADEYLAMQDARSRPRRRGL